MTSLTDKSDGISGVLCGGELVVYGGSAAGSIWCYSPEKHTWRAVMCGGDVPHARKWHTAVAWKDEMYVYGGETSHGTDDGMYALSLTGRDAYVWEIIHTFGPSPGARSHHASVVVDEHMYVFGGKVASHPTVAAHQSMLENGFYDLFRLHLPTLTWERLEMPAAIHPALWGHSAVMFRHFILCYGGFELLDEPAQHPSVMSIADTQPPTAELNDVVYIYNTHRMEWTKSSPKETLRPAPRALHNAVAFGSDMVIFGGLALDHASRAQPVNDAWRWDIVTGKWAPLPFCLKHWKSSRLLCCMNGHSMHVIHDLALCNVMDMRIKKEWVSHACDVSGLANPTAASERQRTNARQAAVTFSPVREEITFEKMQRAAVREDLGFRLRNEMETDEGLEKATHVEMLQKQITDLKVQMEEMSAAQRQQQEQARRKVRPEALPQLQDRDRQWAYHQDPTGPPPAATNEAGLTSQVSQLISAVSRLKALSGQSQQQPPPQPQQQSQHQPLHHQASGEHTPSSRQPSQSYQFPSVTHTPQPQPLAQPVHQQAPPQQLQQTPPMHLQQTAQQQQQPLPQPPVHQPQYQPHDAPPPRVYQPPAVMETVASMPTAGYLSPARSYPQPNMPNVPWLQRQDMPAQAAAPQNLDSMHSSAPAHPEYMPSALVPPVEMAYQNQPGITNVTPQSSLRSSDMATPKSAHSSAIHRENHLDSLRRHLEVCLKKCMKI